MVNRELLLRETTAPILEKVKNEYSELVGAIGADEGWEELSLYLYDEGYRRLSSEIGLTMEDLILTIVKAYRDTILMILDGIGYKYNPDNIAEDVLRLLRFINFMQFMKQFDRTKDFRSVPRPWEILRENYSNIREFIFNRDHFWRPNDVWGRAFIEMENHTRNPQNDIGFRPYYIEGMAIILRNIRNKHEHPEGFEKEFITNISETFYNDFTNMVGVYNLSIMAHIELLEAWVSVSDCFDQETGELTL